MDTKLINIKKCMIYIASFFFMSCSVTSNKKYIKNFKKEFKAQAYCNCIEQGYNIEGISSKMILIDKSFYSPFIYSVFSEELHKIGISENNVMRRDSINSIKTVSEAFAGKKILSHCLNFYKSKKLDSITSVNYKKFRKLKNLDSIIANKNPAY